jgi:DNA-binding NarL/FixJ family response regulator
MSSNGSGAIKRQQAKAKYAYRLRQSGYTNRQIAEALVVKVKTVPGLVKAGARLSV